jgi:hypothetical protein
MRRSAEWMRKTVISMRNKQIVNHSLLATVIEGNNKYCVSLLEERYKW